MEINIAYRPDIFGESQIEALAKSIEEIDEIDNALSVHLRNYDLSELLFVLTAVTVSAVGQVITKVVEEIIGWIGDEARGHVKSIYVYKKLKKIPLKIRFEIKENASAISFRIETKSIDHFKNGMTILPILCKQHLNQMIDNCPSNVRSILVPQDNDTGKFKLAVGHDEKERPIYCYDFEENLWKKVRY